MGGTVQGLDAFDDQPVGPDPFNIGAHGGQARGEVADLRLARGVGQHGRALGERGGHHQVLGGADRHLREGVARALQAVRFDLEPDTQGFDLIASYQDRAGVLYRDRLGGNYSAIDLNELPAGATNLIAFDFNYDGRTDLAA